MASKHKAALLQRTPTDEPVLIHRAPETAREADPGAQDARRNTRGGHAQRAYGNQFLQRMSRFETRLAQRDAGGASGGEVSDAIETRIEGQRGGGTPLAETARAPYERSLGADFSDVRVHTGSEAGRLNRALGAKAFTTGSDIFFGENQFEPESPSGQKLIAHELTHVVQQGGAGAQPQRVSQRQPVQREGEQGEETADDAAEGAEEGAEVAEERIEASVEEEVEAEREDEDEVVPTMAEVIAEAVAEATPVETGMPDVGASETADVAEPTELTGLDEVGLQAKMEVSAANDPYEEEADAIAAQVVEGQPRRPDEETAQAAVQPIRPMQLQRSARRGTVQRDEDVEAEEEAIKQQEEAELKNSPDAPSEEERREQEAQAQEKGGREGEQLGEQQGREAMAEQDEGETEVQDEVPEAGGPPVPEMPPIPEEPAPAAESKPVDVLDSEQDEVNQAAPEQAAMTAEALGWAASEPANWDEETAFHELFTMAAQSGPEASPDETARSLMPMSLLNLQRHAGAGRPSKRAPNGGVQRDAAAPSTTAPTAPAAASSANTEEFKSKASTNWGGGEFLLEKKDDDVIPVPRHENVFAQAMIGDTASKGAETINKFASVRNETNPYGVMATLLEGVIKVMEIVTAIIGIITLILSLVAAILYAVGAALMALFGAGAALIAVAAKMTALIAKMTAVVIKILVVRIKLRIAAIVLRGLDVLFMLLSGADMKDIKKKLWMMADQGIGIVTDGISLALAVLPAKIQGSSAYQSASAKLGAIKTAVMGPATMGPQTLAQSLTSTALSGAGKAAVSVIGSGAGRVAGGAIVGGINEGKEAIAADEDELAAPDPTAVQDSAEEEEEKTELAPPPQGVEDVIEGTAAHLADAGQEKAFLVSRISTIDEILIKKIQWNEDMNLMHSEIASEKASLDASDQILEHNMATADRFSETAKQGQGPASEAMHSAESAGGSLHGMQGQLDSSMKRAEEEKPGQMGNVDKGQMMGGPGQSKDSAGQAGDVMTDGVSEAEQAKAESQESKDHNAEARGLADDADEKVADKQGENEQDVQHLLEEKEACLARLAEIESQESELTQLHDEAVGEAHGWAEEHASKRERLMASAGSE